MPDYNIKEISSLKLKIQIFDRIILAIWIALIVLVYYDISIAVGILLGAQIVVYIIRKRLKKKLREKEILAQMVEERTTDLRQERDKVVQESKELSDALDALAKAQDELVRKEKLAAVGNLTSGLLDRILNPVNYINNFSGLTISHIDDLRKDMEEIRDRIPAENYENITESLDLIHANLEKIHEHGNNTVRIVKAMEELIRHRHGNTSPIDIRDLCKVNVEMIRKHYAETIEKNGIGIICDFPEEPVIAEVDKEEINKVLYHLISNSIYAVNKRMQKETFKPEISVSICRLPHRRTQIRIKDNGIGIEKNNIGKVFEPFFTTKPTSEAAGTGLYLCKEIILNHKGTIEAVSEKGLYTEFRIIIPDSQNPENHE